MPPIYSLGRDFDRSLTRTRREAPIPVESSLRLHGQNRAANRARGELGIMHRNKDGSAVFGVNSSHPNPAHDYNRRTRSATYWLSFTQTIICTVDKKLSYLPAK